jgi:general secretion pathway protein E/type IV pilus assembly protein PilB
VSGNAGPGIWLDQSVVGATVARNVVADNEGSGVELELSSEIVVAGNVVAVIGQRLGRRLCPHCKESHAPDDGERVLLGSSAPIYRARGCIHCAYKGYRGRLPLMELLLMDGDMDEAILRGATPRELAALAEERGWKRLAEDGLDRVRRGDTSLAEISRVVDLARR